MHTSVAPTPLHDMRGGNGATKMSAFKQAPDPAAPARYNWFMSLRALVLSGYCSGCIWAQIYTVMPINPPDGYTWGGVSSISGSRLITGAVIDARGHVRAVVASPSGSAVLPLLAGWPNARGSSINNSGQVAGIAQDANLLSNVAFVGSADTGVSAIPVPPGWTGSSAGGINSSGLVAGGGGDGFHGQPFIGTASGITLIPLPAGLLRLERY